MKRTFIIVATLTLLVACGKEEDEQTPRGTTSGLKLTTESYIGPGTKTAVIDNSVLWVNGDKVKLNNANCDVTVSGNAAYVASGVPSETPLYGYYPNNLTVGTPKNDNTTISIPHEYSCSYTGGKQVLHLPMVGKVTEANPTAIEFKHLTAAVKVMIRNTNLASLLTLDSVIVSSSTLQLSGQRNVTIDVGSVTVSDQSGTIAAADKRVKISFATNTCFKKNDTIEVQVPFWPVAQTGDFTIKIYTHVQGARNISFVYERSNSNPQLTRNQMMTARVDLNSGNDFITKNWKGRFVINTSGNFVYFSQGNLMYSNNTWSFHTNQYDRCFTANGSVSTNYTSAGTFDLFRWGSSGNVRTPYDNSSSDNTDAVNGSTDISGTENDWGMHNAISNGGNTAGVWRTLTQSEWHYLLSRKHNDKYLCNAATVDTIRGYVILPDDWVLPDGCSFTGYDDHNTNNVNAYSQNVYTLANGANNWAKMEAAGAVFLPACGYTDTDYKIKNIHRGYYWSSTHAEGTPKYTAYDFKFFGAEEDNKNYHYTDDTTATRSALPVRLVMNGY